MNPMIPDPAIRLSVYIFSFNRGDFLAHALDSVRSMIPQAVVKIVDDHSDDAATIAFLAQCAVPVLQPESADKARHGGLYQNMQLALEDCESDYCLFLQDDMQIVRPVDATDYQYINDFFAAFPDAGFLNPVFLKGQRARRDARITNISDDFPVYFRHYPNKKHPRGISYADVVIAHKPRLMAKSWQFSQGEVANAEQAMQWFGRMGMMRDPFVMFLPQVPVFRGKQKTAPVKLAERLAGNEPKKFVPMQAEQVNRLRARDMQQLPVAEDFLMTCDKQVKKPFHYSVVNVYPWLRVCHKLIVQWRKTIGR
ncbi:MAG: glycosyltransferase [Idiomarina sp.]|nr:glycosyltransferase [Idiomarina sp.]